MQTPMPRYARLVAAFEDLSGQEEASLHARDFPALEAIQERLAAVVDELQTQASAANTALRARIVATQARRERSSEWLAGEIARTREELRDTEGAQRRVARIAPVYGAAPMSARVPSKLSFVG